MNHSFEVDSISNSNSDNSYISVGASTIGRIGNLANSRMNREKDGEESQGTGKNDKQPVMTPLPEGFSPGDHDVICGRGKKCYAHAGNERFRQIVQSHLEPYLAASSRPEKSEILSSIVAQVRNNSPNGGFVKQDIKTGAWFEVGDFLAREKTSQAFRDALPQDYRSSKKAKHEKRRQRTKQKALEEKLTSKGGGAVDQGEEQHQGLYPSPLISRQQLTVLREEINPHPRSFSFSGLTHEPSARTVPSRALSLSSGRHGGRLVANRNDLDSTSATSNLYELSYREPYRRPESAPDFGVGYDNRYPADDLNVGMGARPKEQFDGHESWPQPVRTTSTRSFFAPPAAPIFHPVGEEDVAAHRLRPDSGYRMHAQSSEASIGGVADVDSVRRSPSRNVAAHLSCWSNNEYEKNGAASTTTSHRSSLDGKSVSARVRRWSSVEADGNISSPPLFSRWPSEAGMEGELSAGTRRQKSIMEDHDELDFRRSFHVPAPNIQPSVPSVERFASCQARAPKTIASAVHNRTDSSSATVIVEQLTNALQEQDSALPDENPFEPIPLPGRSKKKAKTEGGENHKW